MSRAVTTFKRLACCGVLVPALCMSAWADQAQNKSWTQKPEIESAVTFGGEQPAADQAAEQRLKEGPTPQWIWKTDNKANYEDCFLRKEFSAAGGEAEFIATCDNEMKIFINGKLVANSNEWKAPVRGKVELKSGKNEIIVEAGNHEGVAAFVLKMAYPVGDKWEYLVTDASWQARKLDAQDWQAVHVHGEMGRSPWGNVFDTPAVDPSLKQFHVVEGFQVERLFDVPRDELGSWVAMTFDHKGRIIASDQGDRGLYRITPPKIGSNEPTKVEKLEAKITSAQGLLYAFDSLYVVVNGGPGSGLYRLRDTNGDDQFDEMEKLKAFDGGGEHGPHAVRLSPDGKSLYVLCGNHTKPLKDLAASRVPTNWDEDLLLPRQWDARGHAAGVLAPGGWIVKTDPEGQAWEMISIGYRNPYDMDFNADGELFTYDADMEWDFGTPWYRPTRVSHVTSGSEFGWRSGTGKWPEYYVDSLPATIDIGPGSPVGVTFGTGAKFPAKYQQALFILDWTFGTMYALHLQPEGASYTAKKEEFVARAPLPLTDAEVGPDGALYFTVGGRKTQSALYRVTYVGSESTAPAKLENAEFADLRALRQKIETYHRPVENQQAAVDFLWPYLGHQDRFIRFAARTALEHQEPSYWQARVLAEKDPQKLITAMVALARQGDKSLQGQALETLSKLDLDKLSEPQQLELLRTYQLLFTRMGEPAPEAAAKLVSTLDAHYPSASDPLNRELCILLVYLKSPTVIEKTLALMEKPYEAKQEDIEQLLARNSGYGGTIAKMLANQPEIEKIHFAFCLRNLRYGWTLEQRKAYFAWLDEARQRSGGASYEGFIDNIRKEALANASEAEREAIASAAPVTVPTPQELPKAKGPGRDWSVAEVVALAEKGLQGRDFENGKRAYAAAQCISCHRFDGSGGATGPDLTNLAGRFSLPDLAEAIIEPSKAVSDQYQASIVITASGRVHNGRILSQDDEKLTILVDPVDITKIVEIPRDDIDEVMPSKVSLMPQDLIKPLNEDEVLDLLAYLLSRGNPQDPAFAGK